jgi:hypothetical protein
MKLELFEDILQKCHEVGLPRDQLLDGLVELKLLILSTLFGTHDGSFGGAALVVPLNYAAGGRMSQSALKGDFAFQKCPPLRFLPNG